MSACGPQDGASAIKTAQARCARRRSPGSHTGAGTPTPAPVAECRHRQPRRHRRPCVARTGCHVAKPTLETGGQAAMVAKSASPAPEVKVAAAPPSNTVGACCSSIDPITRRQCHRRRCAWPAACSVVWWATSSARAMARRAMTVLGSRRRRGGRTSGRESGHQPGRSGYRVQVQLDERRDDAASNPRNSTA